MNYNIDLSDREFFRYLKTNEHTDSYLTAVIKSRAAERSLFAIARRRQFRGEKMPFRGVVTTAISPDYFSDYYAGLAQAQDYTIGLVRQDGAILAWYPALPDDITQLPASGPLVTAIHQGTKHMVADVSPGDNAQRIFAFRRLPRQDVVVLVGASTAGIMRQWSEGMAYHLHLRCSGDAWPRSAVLVCGRAGAPRISRLCAAARGNLAASEHGARAAPGAEDGSSRPAHRRYRARLQQSADRDHRQHRPRAAPVCGQRSARGTLHERCQGSRSARSGADPRLLAFSRQQPHEVKLTDVNRLVRDMSELLSSTLGESVDDRDGARCRPMARCARSQRAGIGAAQPRGECARRHGRTAARLTIETSNAYLDEDYVPRKEPRSPGPVCAGRGL